MKKLLLLSCFFGLAAFVQNANAQSEITFQISLKPEIEEGTFDLSDHKVLLSGDIYPLGERKPIEMVDEAPIDSIYTATIKFPASQKNNALTFSYILKKENESVKETRPPRMVTLKSGKHTLDLTYFNNFSF